MDQRINVRPFKYHSANDIGCLDKMEVLSSILLSGLNKKIFSITGTWAHESQDLICCVHFEFPAFIIVPIREKLLKDYCEANRQMNEIMH